MSSSPEGPEASRKLSTERLVGSRNLSVVVSRRNTRNDPAYLELEAAHFRFSLRAKEAVDKILRYEAAIERQLYRAINELERLQSEEARGYRPSSDPCRALNRLRLLRNKAKLP